MRSLWWIGEQVGANISWLVASHLYPQVINSSCLFARPLIVDQFIFRTVFTETRSAQTYQVQSCNSPKKWRDEMEKLSHFFPRKSNFDNDCFVSRRKIISQKRNWFSLTSLACGNVTKSSIRLNVDSRLIGQSNPGFGNSYREDITSLRVRRRQRE